MFAIIWTYLVLYEDMSYGFFISVTHENCACDIHHSFAFALLGDCCRVAVSR